MKKLLLFFLLISSFAWGQPIQDPKRTLYGTRAEVKAKVGEAAVFVVVPNLLLSGNRNYEVFVKDPNDDSSPESDSVIVSGSVRLKRLLPLSATSVSTVAWSSGITGKPTEFPPSAHNHTIAGLTGYGAFNAAKQDTLGSGATNQILTWGRVWRTPDKSWFGLNNVSNVDATNADNLGSGSIPTGRFGVRTIPNTALAQSGATDGQVLKWSTALNRFVPKNDSLGGGPGSWGGLSGTLSSQTDLQSALDAKAAATRNITTGTGLTGGGNLSADRTISIALNGVTNARLAQMANLTFKGNISGSTADPSDVSVLSLPVSTATQTALDTKAPTASPTFTGTPLVPTAAIYTNTTQIASTAFVNTISATKVSFKTVSELKAFTSTDVTNNPRVYITDSGKEGEFRYVSGSSASDNTGTMLVTTSGGYRFERVVSGNILPEWFGAAGDGSTYDTTPIQNALNYAASIGAGAVVQLSAKNYKVTTLTIPDSVKLIGHDTKLTQVRANGTAVPVITCGNNTTISGLNIVCDPVSNVYANNGAIYIFNKNNVSISDCYVKNHGVFGVMIDRGKNVTVRNNRFWTNNHLSDINSSGGTVWSNSSDIFIYTDGGGYTENVLIHGNKCNSPFTSQGIWVNGVGYEKNIIISNNICATTNEDGSVWTSTNYWLDSGSGFTRRHGIVASYQSTAESGAILITGNICKTTIVTGIYVSGVGGGKGVNVTGNTCIDNGYTTNSDRSLAGGIAVTGSTGLAHIVGNTIIDFKASSNECGAINVQRNLGNNVVHNVYIADNSIINSAGVGYRIQTSSDNVTINGGLVRNSGLNDVYYNNFSTSSSNIDNWLRIKNLTIIRNNITSRSVYVDATANKKIEIDGVSIKSIDSTTNNGTNSGICVINPYQPVKITNCIFDNMYDGIFIPTGGIIGRRKNLMISNNYFLNVSYAVHADCNYGVGETIILGTNNRYEGIISGLCRFTNYGAYFEGTEMKNDYSVTMPLSNISMSSGTWVKGDRIYIDYPTTGNPYLKVVQTSGTFGTLSGVTGSIASGTKTLTVSSSTNIREGMYINIAGVTGTKRVTGVVGTTVTIDSNANATVSSAAVSYQTPSIITAITLP